MPTVYIGDNTTGTPVMDYSGTEDVRIRESAPTTNYGTLTVIETSKYGSGDHTHSLLSFSGISNLPSSLTVTSAIISLYLSSANSGTHTVTIKRLLRSWVENEATWNIFSTGNSWTTAGALSDGNDRSGTVSDTITGIGTTTGQYYNSNDAAQIQADVEDFADGTLSNYGWHLERTDGANDATFRQWSSSDESGAVRPYITITYTVGGTTLQNRRYGRGIGHGICRGI